MEDVFPPMTARGTATPLTTIQSVELTATLTNLNVKWSALLESTKKAMESVLKIQTVLTVLRIIFQSVPSKVKLTKTDVCWIAWELHGNVMGLVPQKLENVPTVLMNTLQFVESMESLTEMSVF